MSVDFLASVPGWAWLLILLAALVFVYGLLNRRWRRQEREAQEQLEREQHLAQMTAPTEGEAEPRHARAATLRAPDSKESPPDAPKR